MGLLSFFRRKSSPGNFSDPKAPEAALNRPFFRYELFSNVTIIHNYEKCAPLYAGVEKIAGSVGSLPVMLRDNRTKQRVESHPALTGFRFPNKGDQKIAMEFFECSARWLVLEGDLFWLIQAAEHFPPAAVEVLNSQFVFIDPYVNRISGEESRRLRYIKDGGQEYFDYDDKTGTYWSENGLRNRQIIHIKNFNPRQGQHWYEGLSGVQPLFHEIYQWLKIAGHNIAMLDNGMRPCGAFIFKSPNGQPINVSAERLERIKLEIAEKYQEASQHGKVLVLPEDLEFIEMSVSPKDMDFKGNREDCQQAIYEVLGVPVQLIAADKTTAGNMTTIRAEFYQNRILPFMRKLLDYYNLFVLPRYRDSAGLEFVVDEEMVDVLIPVHKARKELTDNSPALTINEKRAKYNLEPVEGGDAIKDPNGRFVAGDPGPFDLEMVGSGKEPPIPEKSR